MARKKLDLTYIVSDTKRRATYKKRKGGLIKKVDEISTLCGIDACAVIYGPNELEPEVWPSPWGARRVISKFKEMPETERIKKMMTQESFLAQRIKKTQEQLKKQMNENRRNEVDHLMFQCLSVGEVFEYLSINDLNDLTWTIDQKLKEIYKKKASRSQGQEGAANGEQARVGAVQKQP